MMLLDNAADALFSRQARHSVVIRIWIPWLFRAKRNASLHSRCNNRRTKSPLTPLLGSALVLLLFLASPTSSCIEEEKICQELVTLWEQREQQRLRISPHLQQIELMSRSVLEFKLSYVCAHLVTRSRPVDEWQNETPLALRSILDSECIRLHG